MDVELTNAKQKKVDAALQNPALKLLFNEQQVNGYNMELKPANNLQLPASSSGYLLVSKSETIIEFEINNTLQKRFMKPSHYIWIEAGKKFSIKTMSKQAANFVLLQLK